MVRAVLQAVAVGVTGRETGAVAGVEDLVTAVGDQHDLAGEDINELVPGGVPMTLARPGARRQMEQVDAELRQSSRVAEFGALARATGRIERRRVERSDHRCQR